jgi:hypothetical protein
MYNSYVSNLIKRVMDASFGSTWEEAVQEWEIVDCEEDETSTSMCVCGKENIRYLYTIQNRETGCVISPIGSSCIQKFEREDLSERAAVLEEMFKLYKAIRHGERIELTSDFFSRRLLFALYKDGAFSPSEYNGYCEYNDYKFLLDMFNKRIKSDITMRQRSKIRGLIAYSIRPYLMAQLRGK